MTDENSKVLRGGGGLEKTVMGIWVKPARSAGLRKNAWSIGD